MSRTLPWWLVCVTAVAVAPLHRATAGEAPTAAGSEKAEAVAAAAPVIRASRLELVDGVGAVRAALSVDEQGVAAIRFYDRSTGRERLRVGTSADGGDPYVVLFGPGGDVKLVLGVQQGAGVLFVPSREETVTLERLLSDEPTTSTTPGLWLAGSGLGLTQQGGDSITVGEDEPPGGGFLEYGNHLLLTNSGLMVASGSIWGTIRPRVLVGVDDDEGRSVLQLSSPSGMADTTLASPQEPSLGSTVLRSAYGDATSTVVSTAKDFVFSCNLLVSRREGGVFFRLSADVREQAGIRTDGLNGYGVIFIPFADQGGTPGLYLVKRVNGVETVLASATAGFPRQTGQTSLTIAAQGDALTVAENGVEVLRATDRQFSEGKLVWRVYGDTEYPARASFQAGLLSVDGDIVGVPQ